MHQMPHQSQSISLTIHQCITYGGLMLLWIVRGNKGTVIIESAPNKSMQKSFRGGIISLFPNLGWGD